MSDLRKALTSTVALDPMTPGEMLPSVYAYCVSAGVTTIRASVQPGPARQPWLDDLKPFLTNPAFTLHLTTSLARDLTDAEIAALNTHGEITVTLDSSSPAWVKEHRGVELRTVIANIVRLKHKMLETGHATTIELLCTISRENATHINELARLARVLKVDRLALTELLPEATDLSAPDGVRDFTDDDARELMISISEAIATLAGTPTQLTVRPGLIKRLQPISQALKEQRAVSAESLRAVEIDPRSGPCLEPWKTAMIAADGGVRTCRGQRDAIGNLHATTLIDLIDGEIARGIRAALLEGTSTLPCPTCPAATLTNPQVFAMQVQRAVGQYDADRRATVAR